MPRKRERFERSDVAKSAAGGTALAVGALVFLIVGLIAGVMWARSRAGVGTSLSDADLSSAVAGQAAVADPAEGYTASTDTFTNVLLLTVDDPSADAPTLTSAQLLSLDVTTGTGTTTLAALYAASGASACVAPLATATNVQVSHVIVGTSDIWDQLAGFNGSGVQSLVGSGSKLLSSIKTDMDQDELMSVAELVQSSGVANWTRVDAPVTAGTLDDGTAASVVDATQLGVQIGTLVAAA